jgi:DNA polymerase I-like protein with 3'-5' exonuclease and polymerase domains
VLDGIRAYRDAYKEVTAFYEPMTFYSVEGVIHPVIRAVGTGTFRMAVEKPNLQQAKKKGPVRRLFKPAPGRGFLFLDYSSNQMRIAAHYARAIPESFQYAFTWACTLAKRGDCKGRAPHGPPNDPEACRKVIHTGRRMEWSTAPERMPLYEGFLSGDPDFDPHQRSVEVCNGYYGLGLSRDECKTGNFACLFGAWYPKLADTLDCTDEVAKRFHTYFWQEAYGELGRVKDFIAERLRTAGRPSAWSGQPFIRTMHGGRLYLRSGHKAMNYLIQRSEREIVLQGVLAVAEYLEQERIPYRFVLVVHDEVILDFPLDSLDQGVVRNIATLLVRAGKASLVPMVVEPEVAYKSWGEKEPLPRHWGCDGVALLKEGKL